MKLHPSRHARIVARIEEHTRLTHDIRNAVATVCSEYRRVRNSLYVLPLEQWMSVLVLFNLHGLCHRVPLNAFVRRLCASVYLGYAVNDVLLIYCPISHGERFRVTVIV